MLSEEKTNKQVESYENRKNAIKSGKIRKKITDEFDDFDGKPIKNTKKSINTYDIFQVGTKTIIGGGLGLLAGVATIAVTASVAEIVIAGAVTKIAGVVGGVVGLSMGVNEMKKHEIKEEEL
ncbi:MAG: hypothetical protein HQK76_13070 [Desulfobacterales bacterium]|nr:hypothetical protein [Desulfobacterales bacterium]